MPFSWQGILDCINSKGRELSTDMVCLNRRLSALTVDVKCKLLFKFLLPRPLHQDGCDPKLWVMHLSFQTSPHQHGLSEQQETDPRQGSMKFSVVAVWVFSFAIVVVNAVNIKALPRSPQSASRPLFLK